MRRQPKSNSLSPGACASSINELRCFGTTTSRTKSHAGLELEPSFARLNRIVDQLEIASENVHDMGDEAVIEDQFVVVLTNVL